MEHSVIKDDFLQGIQRDFLLKDVEPGALYTNKNTENNNIVFVLDGEFEFSYNEFIDRRFVKGDFFFLPQSADIRARALKHGRLFIFIFNTHIITVSDKQAFVDYNKVVESIDYDFRPFAISGILWAYINLMEMYVRDTLLTTDLIKIKSRELFTLLKTTYSNEQMAEFFYPIIGNDVDFKSKFLESYHLDYGVNEFAKMLSMSPSHFARKFKYEFNQTFYQWKLRQKANHIKHKLSLPGTTITDIVNDFNFSSPSHFTKYCKTYLGCTPTELVKRLRG